MLDKIFTKKEVKVFLFLFVLSFIYTLPILNADRYYIDDLGRSIWGYSKWGVNGRPLADILMAAISFGYPLLDISPLPQITGLAVLCASLAASLCRIVPNFSSSAITISALCFVLNPFMLENLSYKYDALSMLLSASLLIISFSFGLRWWHLPVPAFMVVCSLSLYQATLTLFASMAVIEFVFSARVFRVRILGALIRILQLVSGYIFYSTYIGPNFIQGSYNISHSETILSQPDMTNKAIQNATGFVDLIDAYITGIPAWIVFITASLSIVGLVLLLIESVRKQSEKNIYKAIVIFIIILSPVAIVAFSFAHLSLLKYPVYAPRVMISFGGVMLIVGLLCCKSMLGRIALLPLFVFSFVFCISYGNTMKSQKEFDAYISAEISSVINKQNADYKFISIAGKMPVSEQYRLAVSKFPLMKELVPIYMDNGWGWGSALLAHYGADYKFKQINQEIKSGVCKKTPVLESAKYDLYDIDDMIVVMFKGFKC